MPEPITFTSQTPRFTLPLLFAGQAQKEFFFNEAQSLVDALLHLAITGSSASPPANPEDGECWIVDTSAQGSWAGQDGTLAIRVSDEWKFLAPRDGMSAFDQGSGQRFFFDGAWQAPIEPAAPQGGAIIDSEARTAIAALVEAMRDLGLFARI